MFLPLINTHVENVLLQKTHGVRTWQKIFDWTQFFYATKKDLMRLLLRIRSFLLSICDLYGKFCLSAPAPSVFVKQLFALFSVGKTGNISGKSCIKQITPPTVPIVWIWLFQTNNREITESGNKNNPIVNHHFPKYWCANIHVSLLFIDIAVLYPYMWLIFFGGLVTNILPNPIIMMGISKSMISINSQNGCMKRSILPWHIHAIGTCTYVNKKFHVRRFRHFLIGGTVFSCGNG